MWPSCQFPNIHFFGDVESYDIIFTIGTEEFWCHKKVLADSSSYFNAMFFSGFKEKDQSRISVDEDPIIFKILLEILYTGGLDDWRERLFVRCCKSVTWTRSKQCTCVWRELPGSPDATCCISSKLWLRCTELLKLADKYDVLEKTAKILEEYLLRDAFDWQYFSRVDCRCLGIKHLMAVLYFFDDLKTKYPCSRRSVLEAILTMKEIQPDLRIDVNQLNWLLYGGSRHAGTCTDLIPPNETIPISTAQKSVVHEFGVKDLSDVTFVVGGEQFKCHKMFLAARSINFKEMIFSCFNEAGVVHLDGDASVFGQLMEIIYNGTFVGWQEVVGCYDRILDIKGFPAYGMLHNIKPSPCTTVPKLWKTCTSLITLADSLGVKDYVVAFLENLFIRYVCFTGLTRMCSCEGAKYIFSLVYGLQEVRKLLTVEWMAFAQALSVIKKLDPDLTFDLDTVHTLLTTY